MTNKEALESLERIIDDNIDCGKKILTDKAITSLFIGIKAIEKRIPKKPMHTVGSIADCFKCPSCKEKLWSFVDDYCNHCGQAIDWLGRYDN